MRRSVPPSRTDSTTAGNKVRYQIERGGLRGSNEAILFLDMERTN